MSSYRMKRLQKPAPSHAGLSFGAAGPSPQSSVKALALNSTLGNQAMESLYGSAVQKARDAREAQAARERSVEGPDPGPTVDIPTNQEDKSEPKQVMSEEWFDGSIAPFLDGLLWRIKDPGRRAEVIKLMRDSFKGLATGWLEKNLDKSGLSDPDKQEILERYMKAADQDWWAPP